MAPSRINRKRFHCSFPNCNAVLSRKADKERHENEVHRAGGRIRCSICHEAIALRVGRLRKHMRECHSVPLAPIFPPNFHSAAASSFHQQPQLQAYSQQNPYPAAAYNGNNSISPEQMNADTNSGPFAHTNYPLHTDINIATNNSVYQDLGPSTSGRGSMMMAIEGPSSQQNAGNGGVLNLDVIPIADEKDFDSKETMEYSWI